MQTQDEQFDQMSEEDELDETFDDVPQKVEITLCAAMANELGEVLYLLHIADTANLKKPIALEITVEQDGKLRLHQSNNDPADALEILAETPLLKIKEK